MRSMLVALLVAGLLLPATVRAASSDLPPTHTTVIVSYRADASLAGRQKLLAQVGGALTATIPEIAVEQVTLPLSSLTTLRESSLVRSVESRRVLHVMGRLPNDPLLKLQWPLRRLDAFRAWRFEERKTPVTVAVIDTGVDASHVDLQERVLDGFDFLDLDEDPYDDHGHGTHVSGIIAANTSNRKGIAGLSQGARIIPMKACTADGACPIFETYESVVDAVRRGAQVINMSLGGAGECSPIDQIVYDYAREQGVLVVVAAGNSGEEQNPVITPASCNFTTGVGAIDQKGLKAPFSSYGDFVDIAAPGVEIWSTLPPLRSLDSPHLGYGPASGTSMASPFVAAAAALLAGRHADWTPAQIEERLLSTAIDAGKRGRDDLYGEGILNLYAALR